MSLSSKYVSCWMSLNSKYVSCWMSLSSLAQCLLSVYLYIYCSVSCTAFTLCMLGSCGCIIHRHAGSSDYGQLPRLLQYLKHTELNIVCSIRPRNATTYVSPSPFVVTSPFEFLVDVFAELCACGCHALDKFRLRVGLNKNLFEMK